MGKQKAKKVKLEEWFTGRPPPLTPVTFIMAYQHADEDQISWGKSGRMMWSIRCDYQGGHTEYHMTNVPICCDLGVMVTPSQDGLMRVQAGYSTGDGESGWTGSDAVCRIVPDGLAPVGERITKYGSAQRPAWLVPPGRIGVLNAEDKTTVDVLTFALIPGAFHAQDAASDY